MEANTGILVLGVTFVLMGAALSFYRRKAGTAAAELLEEKAHREGDLLNTKLGQARIEAEEAVRKYESTRRSYLDSKSSDADKPKG